MPLKKVASALIGLMWPVSLYVANKPLDFLQFAIPAILALYSLYLAGQNSGYRYFPLLLIPLVEPKLVLLPVLFGVGELVFQRTKAAAVFTALSVLIAVYAWQGFKGQTIFTKDYEAGQLVIRNQQLYPSPFTARLFHNKARIVVDKFADNFFALTDPGNYFFGFAPRQIGVVNQNLDKYPFLSITFLLIGLYYFNKLKNFGFIFTYLCTTLIALSCLSLFDKQDIVLWPALSAITIHGVNEATKRFPKHTAVFVPLFLIFTFVEYLRLIIRWS